VGYDVKPDSAERAPSVRYGIALAVSIACSICGQLLMKWAAAGAGSEIGQLEAGGWLVAALSIYTCGVVGWAYALRAIPLGVAYSIGGLNYVGILLGAHYWLGESVTPMRILGVALILGGVVLMVVPRTYTSGHRGEL
jgi:spermidine export protein MdtJ